MTKIPAKAVVTIAVLGGFAAAAAVAVGAGVRNSKHDFSADGWSQEQLCLPCHVPHQATPTQGAPLWARSVDPGKKYLIARGEMVGGVGSASAVCLSCHDGSTALDSYGGVTGNVTIRSKRARIGEGGDLSGDHPIGVAYPDGVKGYWPKSLVRARNTIRLPNGQVECISCHDVHDESGNDYMLVESNQRSNLCQACHNK